MTLHNKAIAIALLLPIAAAAPVHDTSQQKHQTPHTTTTNTNGLTHKRRLFFDMNTFEQKVNETVAAIQHAGNAIHPQNARYAYNIAKGIDAIVNAYETALEDEAKGVVGVLGDQVGIDGVEVHDAMKGVIEALADALFNIDDFNQNPTFDQGVNSSAEVIDTLTEQADTLIPLLLNISSTLFGCA